MFRPAASLLIALLAGAGAHSQAIKESMPEPQVVVIGRIESDTTRVESPSVVRADSETATEEERVRVRRIVFRVDRVVKGNVESAVIAAYSLRKIWVPKPESGPKGALRQFLTAPGAFARDLGTLPGPSVLPILKLWELSLVPTSDGRYCPIQRARLDPWRRWPIPCFELVVDGVRSVKDMYPEGRRLRAMERESPSPRLVPVAQDVKEKPGEADLVAIGRIVDVQSWTWASEKEVNYHLRLLVRLHTVLEGKVESKVVWVRYDELRYPGDFLSPPKSFNLSRPLFTLWKFKLQRLQPENCRSDSPFDREVQTPMAPCFAVQPGDMSSVREVPRVNRRA